MGAQRHGHKSVTTAVRIDPSTRAGPSVQPLSKLDSRSDARAPSANCRRADDLGQKGRLGISTARCKLWYCTRPCGKIDPSSTICLGSVGLITEQHDMSNPETQSTAQPPQRSWFQFSLRTLMLLFVVLASSLAVFGAWGIGVFVGVMGLAFYFQRDRSLWDIKSRFLIVLFLICLVVVAFQKNGISAHLAACAYNMRQIVEALHNYHADHACFPPAYIADKNGKPMHSWRALLLPYMDCGGLNKVYDFTERWDGPKNKKLLALRPGYYACPDDPTSNTPGAQQANYFAVMGPNAGWAGDHPRKLGDFSSRASDTIMLVEVANSGISWMEPRDVSIEALQTAGTNSPALVPSSNHHAVQDGFFLTYEHSTGFDAAMADGEVQFILPGTLGTQAPQAHLNWPNIAALAVWLISVGTLLACAVRSRKPLAAAPTPPAR